MKKSCFKLTFFVLLVTIVLSLNSAYADTEISGPYNISTPGNYYLINNITPGELGENDAIINIFCSNVTLDGKGYTIKGNYNSYGIVVRKNPKFIKNITIKNFKMENLERFGICIMNTTNSHILNNTVNSAYDSIALMNSSNNTIKNNNVSLSVRTGIEAVMGSNNNTIINNTVSNCQFGIDMGKSLNNTVINNTLYNAGICVGGDYYGNLNPNIMQWINHTIVNNTVNGKPIYYYKNNITGKVPKDAGQVILVNCSNMNVENLTLNNVSMGIDLGFCSNITVKNITMGNNSMANILAYQLHNSSISNNTIGSGKYGISLHYSNNNTICNNNISKFSEVGIIVATHCTNNTIENNELYKNNIDCMLDNSFNNTIKSNKFTMGGLTIRGSQKQYWNTHNITDNTVNGKPIYYYKNNNSEKVPEDAGQVILANCSNMNVENLAINNVSIGISLGFCSNITVINTNMTNIYDYGVYCSKSPNTTINNTRIVGIPYQGCGIYLKYSEYSSCINNNIVSVSVGILTTYSNNLKLINNDISSKSTNLAFITSDNSEIASNKIYNSALGIYLNAKNTKIYNNYIYSNNNGLLQDNPNNNSIYNNTFNNTRNVLVYDIMGLNYFNTTKENGGGNYWFTPEGTGFSEITPDKDGDGFCDEIYNISKGNIDYLPKCFKREEPAPKPGNNNNNRHRTIDASTSIDSKSLRRTVSESSVVYGSSFDKQLAENLKENIHSDDTEIDGDTIIIGGPRSNRIANQYNDRFSIPVTNDNPGENRGIIQVISIPSGSSTVIQNYKLIYIAGSDRLGTEAALKYFETLTELPEEPIIVEWTSSGYNVVN
ncbi:parallel beta-helix repeat protein [Methanococcus voltae]|uniref:NosD domain-containing protein n=1 Tax=Methanococcus voltae TaxID=2188 RepID=UPI001AE5A7BB|nr:NosD domain-containing protein [Methanococcus voltae]MBP2144474.1 parallel beta-helix repeat protein [Methanococcus voltae]